MAATASSTLSLAAEGATETATPLVTMGSHAAVPTAATTRHAFLSSLNMAERVKVRDRSRIWPKHRRLCCLHSLSGVRLTREVSCKAAQEELGAHTQRWGRLVSFTDSLYGGREGLASHPADRLGGRDALAGLKLLNPKGQALSVVRGLAVFGASCRAFPSDRRTAREGATMHLDRDGEAPREPCVARACAAEGRQAKAPR